jgi:hypothetical protein
MEVVTWRVFGMCESDVLCSSSFAEEMMKDESLQVGLMLNERVVNLPPQLVPSLHKCLEDDVEWSLTTEVIGDSIEFPFF